MFFVCHKSKQPIKHLHFCSQHNLLVKNLVLELHRRINGQCFVALEPDSIDASETDELLSSINVHLGSER